MLRLQKSAFCSKAVLYNIKIISRSGETVAFGRCRGGGRRREFLKEDGNGLLYRDSKS